jgi:hypothetical protein
MDALQNMLSKIWHSAALFPSVSPCPRVSRLRCPSSRLARGCDVPGTALLDLGDVKLEKVVQPSHEFLSAKALLLASADIGAWPSSQPTPRALSYLDSPMLNIYVTTLMKL